MAGPPNLGPPGLPPPFGSGSPLPFPKPSEWGLFTGWTTLRNAVGVALPGSLRNANRVATQIMRMR